MEAVSVKHFPFDGRSARFIHTSTAAHNRKHSDSIWIKHGIVASCKTSMISARDRDGYYTDMYYRKYLAQLCTGKVLHEKSRFYSRRYLFIRNSSSEKLTLNLEFFNFCTPELMGNKKLKGIILFIS